MAQNQELADLKFRLLLSELREFKAISVLTPTATPQPKQRAFLPHTEIAPSPTALATLPLPLGDIAVSSHAASLPAIGLNLGHSPLDTQVSRLRDFLLEHNQEPFVRPLFLASNLSLLPLLGRFGFAFHRYHESVQQEIPYLAVRYGLHQIRALDKGMVEWSAL
ncbi:MAG: hypothetical protein AAGA08_07955 [Pseudomonadota bacterium]